MMPQAYINGERVPLHASRLPVRCKRCRKDALGCACADAEVIGVVP